MSKVEEEQAGSSLDHPSIPLQETEELYAPKEVTGAVPPGDATGCPEGKWLAGGGGGREINKIRALF